MACRWGSKAATGEPIPFYGVSANVVVERIQEAIALWLEVEGDSASELKFAGIQRVCVEE
jgi:predicted RNase H-like HicB family nuclease